MREAQNVRSTIYENKPYKTDESKHFFRLRIRCTDIKILLIQEALCARRTRITSAVERVTCDHTLPPLYSDAVKEGMIHLLAGSYVKKPDSGVFSDWSRNNAYETLHSYWLSYFNLISGQNELSKRWSG